jgi:O-antigen ligase
MQVIFSKEFAFTLLLLSGTLKAIMPLLGISGIPDLTLLSAFLVTIIMILHMKTTIYELSYRKVELLGLITLFYLFMIFSLGYTSSASASITKTINFGTMVLSFYFPLLIKDFNLNRFISSLTLFIFISSVVFLNFYTSYLDRDATMILSMGEEEAKQMTALYLTVSWLNGILVLYYFFQKNQTPWIQWSILTIAFIFLISAGGRGPLIFVILVLAVYLVYQLIQTFNTFKLKKLIVPVLILISITASTIFIVSNTDITKENKSLKLVDHTVKRLMGLANEKGGGASAHSRIENAKFSMEKINQNPFWGYGVGSYAYEKKHMDILDYPHNLFLEVWFELGYLPLLIFLFLFYRIYKNIDPDQCSWCMALYFYFILNVLKSSSLIDIRMMLGFYAIFITIVYVEEKEENKKNKDNMI